MLLEEFKKYNSQYEKGTKKISLRSAYPKVERKTLDLTLEKSFGNYDLFFNRKGVLLHSVHIEKNKSHKVIYGYNREGILISSMSLLSEKTNCLLSANLSMTRKGELKLKLTVHFFTA